MHLSCPSWSFGTQHVTGYLPLEGALRVVAALGFDACEIGFGHLQPALIAARPQREADRVRRVLDETGLELCDLFPWFATRHTIPPFTWRNCSVNVPDSQARREVLELFDAVVRFARAVGSPGITVSSGPVYPELGREGSFEASRTALAEMVARAHAAGVQLSIEPHLESPTDSPETTLQMVQEVPGLQVTLDYSHFVAVGRPTPDGDVLIPHARRVDARQARRGKVQCRLEEGEIDFEHVVTALTRAGYRGTISTEYVCVDYQGCNDLDVVTETLKMKRHIEGLLRKTFPVGVVAP
ncbi:MAG TPA: sugar phosphate isomerase/epimerase family protein [Chloroflexota bacterium]